MGVISAITGIGKKPPVEEVVPSLSSLLNDESIEFQPVLLRPASAAQKVLMIEGVISSRKDLWAKGGYVFTGRQDAADVIRVLNESKIDYEVFPLSSTHEHCLLMGIARVVDDKKVFVYVDDDSLPANKRNDDYKRFLGKVIEQCRKWDDESISHDWSFLPIFYVDLTLASVTGYSVRMVQARKRFGTYVLSSKNTFEREVDQRLAGFRETDEMNSIVANSVCIYGSGKRNHAEILKSYGFVSTPSISGPSGSWGKDLADLQTESSLAFANHPEPRVIDLES